MRGFYICAALALVVGGDARGDEPFAPATPEQVPGYFPKPLPCHVVAGVVGGGINTPRHVECDGEILEKKSLRELAILRNTIYSRYGWDGYRKAWLRDYFHAQPWFKPNPKFSYKLLNEIDRQNAHLIGTYEQTLATSQLDKRQSDLLARNGKVWAKPSYTLPGGKRIETCDPPKGAESDDPDSEAPDYACVYEKERWYKPNPKFSFGALSVDDKIELGLLARAMGRFAVDGEPREKSESSSLERMLKLEELRQLSPRDLRLLRNTIYARRGRTFKSEVLRDHFKGMDWYKPRPDYNDKLLSKNDVRNIALIKTVEYEYGGPINDEEWLKEPEVDGA